MLPSATSRCGAEIPHPTDAPKPQSPDLSAASFHLPDGFRIEVIASEPLISSPSGVCWDEQGRLFVCELHGYNLEGQLDIEELNKSGQLDTQVRRVQADEKFKRAAEAGTYGVVKRLADTNGDGRMDSVEVWATNLPPAYGLVPARGGVIVACAPHIVFLEDRDGDGRAEVQEKLFTGFRTGALERGINAPQWSVDGWIYFGRGWGGGLITGPHLEKPVELPNSDFRIRSDGSGIEPVTGSTHTFGFAMTEAGDRFTVTTTTPGLFIAPLPWRYLIRNPNAPTPAVEVATGDRHAYSISKPHPWRQKRAEDPAYFKYYNSRYGAAESEADGWFTAACSPLIYQDTALPGLHGQYFVCEPSGNLIHRALVQTDGSALKLLRAPGEEKSEFAGTTDQWSHPMNLSHGPDGCIWITDYYREIIEDYSAIPRHLQQQYGVYAGHNYGRILRLAHRDLPKSLPADMSQLGSAELAAECGSSLLWRRQTAQRLLVERGAKDAGTILRDALSMRQVLPSQIITSLRTMDQLGVLSPNNLEILLRHESPAVRIHALQLAERWMNMKEGSTLTAATLAAARTEKDPRVKIQFALSVGEIRDARAIDLLALYANEISQVQWLDAAIVSSVSGREIDLLTLLLKSGNSRRPVPLMAALAQSIASRGDGSEFAATLQLATTASLEAQSEMLQAMAKARKSSKRQAPRESRASEILEVLASSTNESIRSSVRALQMTMAPGLPAVRALNARPPTNGPVSDETFRRFIGALTLPRDLDRGHQLFLSACASCHRIGNEGTEVGPDLLGQVGLPEEALLQEILLPDEKIRPGFETTLVDMSDGRTVMGILKSDGATSLTVSVPSGPEFSVLRSEVASVRRLATSLMPSYSESLSPTEVANVLAWVRSNLARPGEAASTWPLPFNTEPSTNGPMPVRKVLAESVMPTGFQLTEFAAEPDVQQPIAMATDARGRLWVAENYTYSERVVGYHPQLRDRIIAFEDVNNDGRFDTRTVFWDGAQRLTSVEVGLGGVWALALPNLYFIPDENRDAIPDGPPQVMLDGFEYQTGRHTIANGLRWGPDGWLYGRHGIQSTSRIGPPGSPPEQRTAMNVGIWRYHPGRHVTEVVAQGTTNPWGMDWDPRGEMFFINTVIGHLWHVIPGAHYRRMYGDDPTPFVYQLIEQTADHFHWATGEVWTDVRKGVTDSTLAAGGGHAHTGLLIYQGGSWPSEWNGKLLTINFHGRQLNTERLERRGTGFVAHHSHDAFRIADPWFRGIDLIAAPDGGVFMADWSDAGECHDQEGIHRISGRIYKIQYGNPGSRDPRDLNQLPDVDLVGFQSSDNDWEARQARRVLAERTRRHRLESSTHQALRKLFATSTNEVVRLRSLWALQVTGETDNSTLHAALDGTEAERAWAIRLLEDRSHASTAGGDSFRRFVSDELARRAAVEPSGLVRLTLASLLQKLPPGESTVLARALLEHAEDDSDPNQPLMLWYGIRPLSKSPGFVELLSGARIPRVQRFAARRLAEEIDIASEPVNALVLRIPSMSSTSRLAILDGFADAFAGRRKVSRPAAWTAAKTELATGADADLKNRLRDLDAVFGDGRALDEIKRVALDRDADLPRRRAALQSLVEARAEGLRPVCEQLLPVRELSATAATGLALFDDMAVADRLLAEWPNLYGGEKPSVLNALISRPAFAAKLLDAIEQGKIRRAELGLPQARQIRQFKNPALEQQLSKVWGTIEEPDDSTKQVKLERWRKNLTSEALQQADRVEGRKAYISACGPCHRLQGEGGTLGPDLTGSGRQNLEYLLDNLLFPNAVVPADFRQTTLWLKDGRSLSGIITQRGPQSVRIELIGQSSLVNREDIEREETSPLSLMPEGLLESLGETQSANLIAYLMSAP